MLHFGGFCLIYCKRRSLSLFLCCCCLFLFLPGVLCLSFSVVVVVFLFLPEGWMSKSIVLIPLPSLIKKKIVRSFSLSPFLCIRLPLLLFSFVFLCPKRAYEFVSYILPMFEFSVYVQAS